MTPNKRSKYMATDKSIQSLRKHLEVLWMTVMKIVAVTVVFVITAFFFKEQLFDVILAPKNGKFITYRLLNRIIFMDRKQHTSILNQVYQHGVCSAVHHSHEDGIVCRYVVYLSLHTLPTVPICISCAFMIMNGDM